MRLRIVIALILTTLIIGGCGVFKGDNSNKSSGNNNQSEAKAKPNVEAFNDQFTEEFLTSTEPVREGYYPLKANTGAFTLDFPEDMIIDETRYNIGPDDRSEVIPFYHPEDKDLVADVIVEQCSELKNSEKEKLKSVIESIKLTDNKSG